MIFWDYLAVQNGAQHVGLVDLLAGRKNHLHAVVVAQRAAMEEVHGTQLLHTNRQTRAEQQNDDFNSFLKMAQKLFDIQITNLW